MCHLARRNQLIAEAFAHRPALKAAAVRLADLPPSLTIRELADASGMDRDYWRRILNQFRELGMAVRSDDGRWTIDLSNEALIRVALQRGTIGLRDRTRAMHARQRMIYLHGQADPT